jgi:hypothetical protein
MKRGIPSITQGREGLAQAAEYSEVVVVKRNPLKEGSRRATSTVSTRVSQRLISSWTRWTTLIPNYHLDSIQLGSASSPLRAVGETGPFQLAGFFKSLQYNLLQASSARNNPTHLPHAQGKIGMGFRPVFSAFQRLSSLTTQIFHVKEASERCSMIILT